MFNLFKKKGPEYISLPTDDEESGVQLLEADETANSSVQTTNYKIGLRKGWQPALFKVVTTRDRKILSDDFYPSESQTTEKSTVICCTIL